MHAENIYEACEQQWRMNSTEVDLLHAVPVQYLGNVFLTLSTLVNRDEQPTYVRQHAEIYNGKTFLEAVLDQTAHEGLELFRNRRLQTMESSQEKYL